MPKSPHDHPSFGTTTQLRKGGIDSRALAELPDEAGRRARHSIETDRKEAYARGFPVHVGVDTGKRFHKLVARGPDGRRHRAVRVDVSRSGFDAADEYLTRMFPAHRREAMLIGLEFGGHHGATFAHDLGRRGYHTVAILPSVTKKLKEVEDNSPRKDDAKDAGQICKLIASGLFVEPIVLSETTAELRVLATERHRLGVEETRLKNRLQAVLDTVWPELTTESLGSDASGDTVAFPGIDTPTVRAILRRWPLPGEFATARFRSVEAVVKRVSRNHIPRSRILALRAHARATIGLTTALPARRAEILRLLERWTLLKRQLVSLEQRLAELVAEHPGARALTTLPGVNVVCAATLVGELGSPETFVSPRQVLKLAGMNLVKTRESGLAVFGRARQTKRGRPLLRRQLFLLSGRWCQKRGLYRAQYEALLARNGGCRVSAVCAVARKLVPMLLHIMQTGESFDEKRWRLEHGLHAAA
jgi:transposase